ncbi:hypothetical protein AEMCBJ_19475 [Cupriavidus necator]
MGACGWRDSAARAQCRRVVSSVHWLTVDNCWQAHARVPLPPVKGKGAMFGSEQRHRGRHAMLPLSA